MANRTLTLSFLLPLLFISSSAYAPIPPSPSDAPCNPHDHNALVAINAHFNYSLWTDDTDCCSWYQVFCNPNTGRVTGLGFNKYSQLAGTLPPALGDLPFLDELGFTGHPNLTGPIPSTISKLTRLSSLFLSENALSGPIPSFLSKLTSLTYINLSRNRFSGSIPPSLGNLRNLSYLSLESNQLTGPIPGSFGKFHATGDSPFYLYLSRNNLSGPIPASLGVPDWVIIDLSRNRLTGDASVLFGASKVASDIGIDISRNMFAFDLTRVVFPLGLTGLELSHNQITGSIPAQINEAPGLARQYWRFNVSYNRLCGEIPAGPVTAHFELSSYVHNKCLCGAPLPPCK